MSKNNISYWEKKYWYEPQDFIIVGAGIVGLTTSIFLKKRFPDKKITIIERGVIPNGASTRNAGFACFGSVGEIIDDLKSIEESEVINTIRMRWKGLHKLRNLLSDYDISYFDTGGYEIFINKEEYDYCYSSLSYVNQLIEAATGEKDVISKANCKINNGFKKCLHNRLEGQLNPVKMIKSLVHITESKGVVIHYGLEVDSYCQEDSHYLIDTKHGHQIKTSKLILCTNAFTSDIEDVEDLVPMRNQVIVTTPIDNLSINGTFHYDKGYVYFRNIDQDRLLIGGARNIDQATEQTSVQAPNKRILSHLKYFAEKYIIGRQIQIDQQWSGIIATGNSKMPLVKKVNEGLYIGIRLGGMGVAIGTMIGQKLSDLVQDDSY